MMASLKKHSTNFASYFLRLQSTRSKTLKNASNSSLGFSLYDMTVVRLHVYATLARMKHFWNVQSANRIATRLMERRPSHISNIFPSSLAFVQWCLILPMHGKCNTGQITNKIQQS